MAKEYKDFKNGHKHKLITAFITVEPGTPPDPCADVIGDGSENNPYQANNFRQLVCMYQNGYVWQEGTNIKLGFDVDLRTATLGYSASFGYWRANLDGAGHTIYWDAPNWGCDSGEQPDGSWGNGVINEPEDFCYDASPFRRVDNGNFKNINMVIGDINAPNFLNAGGIVGNVSNASFENINIEYVGTVYSDDQRGGFAGFLDGPTQVKDITVNNFRVEACAQDRDISTGANGGFTPYFGSGSIENVTITNTFIDCPAGNHAGFISSIFNPVSIKNVTIENTILKARAGGQWAQAAGFVGFPGPNSTVENVTIRDLVLVGEDSPLSGFFGSVWEGVTTKGVLLENISIEANNVTDGFWPITGFSDGMDGEVSLENIDIKTLDIKTYGQAEIAGFVLNGVVSYGNMFVNNLYLERVSLLGEPNLSGSGAGCISGVFCTLGEMWNNPNGDITVRNVTVNNLSLEDPVEYAYSPMAAFSAGIGGSATISDISIQNVFADVRGGGFGTFAQTHYGGTANIDRVVISDVTMDHTNFVAGSSFFLRETGPDAHTIANNVEVRNLSGTVLSGEHGALMQMAMGRTELNNITMNNVNNECFDVWSCANGVTWGEGELIIDGLSLTNSTLKVTGGANLTAGFMSGAGLLDYMSLNNIHLNNVHVETFNPDMGWEVVGILIAAGNEGDVSTRMLNNVLIENSSATSHSSSVNNHRMMGGAMGHIYNGSLSLNNVKVINSELKADYYAITGGILGEITLGSGSGNYNCSIHNGDPDNCGGGGLNACAYSWPTNTCEPVSFNRIEADIVSAENVSINIVNPQVDDWKSTTMGQIFGLITPAYFNNQETRGYARLNNVFANGTITSYGIGQTWARSMTELNNSLYVDQSVTGSCAIGNAGSGEIFNGMNNYSLYCVDDENLTTTPSNPLDPASYPGFDFANVWEFIQGIDHPTLR